MPVPAPRPTARRNLPADLPAMIERLACSPSLTSLVRLTGSDFFASSSRRQFDRVQSERRRCHCRHRRRVVSRFRRRRPVTEAAARDTRLGAIYQLFSAVFAAYLAVVFLRPGFISTRELGALSSVSGAGVLVRLLDQYFWRWYFEEKRKAPIPKFIREVTGLLVFRGRVACSCCSSAIRRARAGSARGLGRRGHHPRLRVAGLPRQHHRRLRACSSEGRFTVGDWLLVDNQHAQAVEINWRSTRFVTTDSVQLDVPNQQIVRQTIVNYHGGGSLHAMRLESRRDRLRHAPQPGQRRSRPRRRLRPPGVLGEPAPSVFLRSFGESGVIYEVRFWLDDHRLYNVIADAVRTNIWYALRRQNIKIPYPIRHLQVERVKPAIPGYDHFLDRQAAGIDARIARAPTAFPRHARGSSRSRLVAHSPVHHYGRGETIIREKADGASMFVLVTGEAAVNVLMDDQQTRVATLEDGDCFGEMSLLTGEKRSASVLAVNDCEVMEITKRTFGEIIARDADLLQRLSELLAQRQMANDGIVQARAQHSALVSAKQQEYQDGFLHKLRSFFEL